MGFGLVTPLRWRRLKNSSAYISLRKWPDRQSRRRSGVAAIRRRGREFRLSPSRMGKAIFSSSRIWQARRILPSSPSVKTTRLGRRLRLVNHAPHDFVGLAQTLLQFLAILFDVDRLLGHAGFHGGLSHGGSLPNQTRGSNGLGIMYWRPNSRRSSNTQRQAT